MGSAREFRFGVAAYSTPSLAEWRELARRVEGLGYSSLLIGDHFVEFQPVAGASPLLALASAAAVTDTLKLGTHVLGNDFRHPAVVAKDAATVDLLSDGRLELGLGAGWLRADYEALGLQYDPASVRVDRLAEAVAIIRSTWRGERFDFSGVHYTIRGYRGLPRPLQRPQPPIMVGGGSPRVLRLAGQHADIVGIHVRVADANADPMTDTQEAQTRRKIEWVKEGAGNRFAELELQMACSVRITDDAATAESPLSVLELTGTVHHLCELLQRRREEWGVSYIVIPAEACEDFSAVVARLGGT